MVFDRFKKKSLDIVCPACQGTQTEPPMAMSTYCRKCGEHLRIDKGVASLTSGPQLSGISRLRVVSDLIEPSLQDSGEENSGNSDSPASDSWVRTSRSPVEQRRESPGNRTEDTAPGEATNPSSEETAGEADKDAPAADDESGESTERPPASVAEVFGLTAGGSSGKKDEESPGEENTAEAGMGIGKEASPATKLGEGSMEAMIPDLVNGSRTNGENGRLKEVKSGFHLTRKITLPKRKHSDTGSGNSSSPSSRDKSRFEIRCFRCNHSQRVSVHAESTQCGRCNTYINLADVTIRTPSDRVIRTRGNVVVQRRGSLTGGELACRDLLVLGPVSTRIDCSGIARFRHSAVAYGNLYCERLVVERGAVVEFPDGVFADSALVQGTVRGNIVCAGLLEVPNGGTVNGDAVAHEIDLQGGGTLTGEMRIDHDLKNILPVVKGYDPSIID